MTEDFVHVAMRMFLKNNGWLLIAGEYPNGSDDELSVLSISDPSVACDNSPDPRRHSTGENVPDLVAFKSNNILVIEAKPKYSIGDKEKLRDLFSNKKDRLIESLIKFSTEKIQFSTINYRAAVYWPVLAFEHASLVDLQEEPGFLHLYVKNLNTCRLTGGIL